MASTSTALVVGLGGVTNGGKTTMCRSLERLFSSEKYHCRVLSMHLDHYFRSEDDPHHRHLPEFDHHDWESVNALDIDLFIADVHMNRQKCDLLLVEGFLIFNIGFPSERDTFDLLYYFDLPYEECLRRRLQRHYVPPDPPGYFQGHVWSSFIKSKKEALDRFQQSNLVILNTEEESFDSIERTIVKDIERMLLNSEGKKTD